MSYHQISAVSSSFDDEPLVRAPDPEGEAGTGQAVEGSSPRLFGIIAAIGIVLGGLGAWYWESSRRRAPSGNASPVVTATEGSLVTSPESARALPPLNQMDTYLRALIGALSSHPELAKWLATDQLIRQMADAIDKVSRGQSPARDVAVLKPASTFEVVESRAVRTIDPDSFRRYTPLATVVSSVDAAAVARAYRTLQPRLEEAYRALGRSESGVDQALGVALDVLIATPAVEGPIAIVPGKGATYAFADPRLEALSPAQKHLIRMGPENQRIILTRLREIANALERSPAR